MENDEIFSAGITAFKAGDLNRAAAIFTRIVKADPASEKGWLWLGRSCTELNQKKYCFQRVIRLNPLNKEAAVELEQMAADLSHVNRQILAASTPSSAIDPGLTASTESTISPFTPEPASVRVERPVTEIKGKEQSSSKVEAEMSEGKQKQNRPVRKRRLSPVLWAFGIFFLIILIGESILYFSGIASGLLASAVEPTWTLVKPPAQLSTKTFTKSPSPTSSPTFEVSPTFRPTIAYTPLFEETPCKFDKPADVSVNCGFVTVPEDRSDPDSPNIKLAVAVFHDPQASHKSDPVIFLQGGPGGEAVMTSVDAFDVLVKPFLAERDYIAFDQRGTGMSTPVIGCQELETATKQDIFGQIPPSTRNLVFSTAFRSCHGMMVVSGIDPNDFNTDASSDDLNDLVTALGYQQVDLYAASYGTRLALATMRKHPQILKSVVLDSVVPLEANFYYEDPDRYNSALKAMFDGCAASQQCAAAYPNLETEFWSLVAKLNSNPVTVTAPLLSGGNLTEAVTGTDLVSTLALGLLKYGWMIPAAPMSLDQIKAGDYSTFIAMQTGLPDEFNGINIGVYISMMCHEHILAGMPAELQKVLDAQKQIGTPYNWIFFGNANDMFNTCKIWGAVPPTAQEKDPVISDIPTLILEGSYDPVTPPMYGKQVAENLSHSYYVEFPDQGHTPFAGDETGCAAALITTFLDDPQTGPDEACLKNLPLIDFQVPYTGNPPVDLTIQEGDKFTAKMPVDWNKYFDGFYRRESTPLDITQLAVVRTYYMDSSEFLQVFSSKLYGYGGFDAPPTMDGVRVGSSGLHWSLYKATSYGRPVNLAVADTSHGDAIVVLLFCHADEHQALYDTVYLPVIDSVESLP